MSLVFSAQVLNCNHASLRGGIGGCDETCSRQEVLRPGPALEQSREEAGVFKVCEFVYICCPSPPKLRQSARRICQNFTNFNNSKLIFSINSHHAPSSPPERLHSRQRQGSINRRSCPPNLTLRFAGLVTPLQTSLPPHSVLIKFRVSTVRVQGNQIHVSILQTLGIPKM